MQVVKKYPNGMASWVDLSTPDPAAAKEFYSGLFGWEFTDEYHEGTLIYHNALLNGYRVAGMGQQDEGMVTAGMPPMWTTYFNHDDVAGIADKATRAGGQVMFPPMQVMEEGHMTMIVDPTGAVFGVWQPLGHIGAQLVNIPNTLVWNELQTNAIGASRDFYAEVLGWEYDVNASGYVSCKVDGRAQAGMVAIEESWGDVPPNWGLYFLVENAASTVARAEELGGTILMPITEADGVGRFAIIRDPQGAIFSAIEYDSPPPPPPGH